MGCTKREKKKVFFGLFEVERPHQWEIIRIWRFMPRTSSTWRVEKECEYCGARKEEAFIKDTELIRQGIEAKHLRKIDQDYFASWHKKRDGEFKPKN